MNEEMEEHSIENLPQYRECALDEVLGINSLPGQTMKKRMQEGFVFNILLVGESGLGKSTLIRSLFNIRSPASAKKHLNSEVHLRSCTYDLCEKGVNLKLSVAETVGYGDQLNRISSAEPIVNYIESQFETYFNEEMMINRYLPVRFDTRIHACLYFICPTGHNLKSFDVFCMKKLHDKVNIIPVVAKSDCLSKEELYRFKLAVNETLDEQSIKVYRFPSEDEEMSSVYSDCNSLIPFAVAASEDYLPVGSSLMRGRTFPWGTMLVENEEHSEFLALRRALIECNMEDMREKTHNEYYEFYRRNRMTEMGFTETEGEAFNFTVMLQRRQSELREEILAREEELKKATVERVKVVEDDLKSRETAIFAKYEHMFETLKEEEKNLNLERDKIEKEILSHKKKVMAMETKLKH